MSSMQTHKYTHRSFLRNSMMLFAFAGLLVACSKQNTPAVVSPNSNTSAFSIANIEPTKAGVKSYVEYFLNKQDQGIHTNKISPKAQLIDHDIASTNGGQNIVVCALVKNINSPNFLNKNYSINSIDIDKSPVAKSLRWYPDNKAEQWQIVDYCRSKGIDIDALIFKAGG